MRGDWKSWWGALLLGGAGCCGLSAAEGDEADAGSGPGEPRKESFVIEDVIHPVIAALPTPEFHEGIVSTPSAVTARNEAAQRHVQQGIALIQAAWDFEAYRHFCEAVRADPECLMAYWGIGLALAAPNNEFMMQRMRAVERMLDLMEAEAGRSGIPTICRQGCCRSTSRGTGTTSSERFSMARKRRCGGCASCWRSILRTSQ